MRQSQLFPSTIKEDPRGAVSINHKLLVRAGFIDQLMAGSWTLLPMGQRVVAKINQIIREEMDTIGSQEVLMPLLHPKNIWNETGRWESAREVMYQFKDSREKEYTLSFTHEEVFLDLTRKHIKSYKNLPLALYHFSTKFRNEARARSGILRGREFLMKDLYSLHADEDGFWKFYESVKEAYVRVFKRIGFNIKVVEAGGGVFTDNHTHEFQVMANGGEDSIYYCDSCDWAQNKEIFSGKEGGKCPNCSGKIKSGRSIEVGNIFPFGTYYSEKMDVTFVDKNGERKPMWFGSYGIGTSRLLGSWVEVSHDKNGIVWSKEISPFSVHLIELPGGKGEETYKKLQSAEIDVLWDDREVGAGEKLIDSELIGIPIRAVTSKKTAGKLELKERSSKKTRLVDSDGLLKVIERE